MTIENKLNDDFVSYNSNELVFLNDLHIFFLGYARRERT